MKEANLLISEQDDLPVVVKVEQMQKGYVDKWHQHPWHQILFPFEGILQTKVAERQFIVPHNGLLFIPANTFHESFVMTETHFIGLYLNPEKTSEYPNEIKAASVSPLLRELVLSIKHAINQETSSAVELDKLLDVLIDQICRATSYQMSLLLPKDRRLMQIFEALLAEPQRDIKLVDWAKKVGASQRTLSRLCTKELGMSFPLWRQHLRLVSSLSLLEDKHTIQEVAYLVGYHSDSAFIYAFKNMFNQTPQQFRTNGFSLSSRVNALNEY